LIVFDLITSQKNMPTNANINGRDVIALAGKKPPMMIFIANPDKINKTNNAMRSNLFFDLIIENKIAIIKGVTNEKVLIP